MSGSMVFNCCGLSRVKKKSDAMAAVPAGVVSTDFWSLSLVVFAFCTFDLFLFVFVFIFGILNIVDW